MATRILYVITKANWGGAQRYVYDLATTARARGYEVTVAYGERSRLVDELALTHVQALPVAGLGRDIRILGEFRAFLALCALYKTVGPSVVHLNSSKAGGLGSLAARIMSVPRIVFTVHGWAFNESRSWWQKVILFVLSVFTVWLSDRVICVSEAVRRDMRLVPFTRKKMVVVRNGLACPATLSREEARVRVAPHSVGKFWIGMLSELHPTKRLNDAIVAMTYVVAKHPEAMLIVIGEGQERHRLDDLVKELHMCDHVFFVGFRENASSLLPAFDMLLHSSQSEALPYTLLEAGCASLPVVATRVGGVPEVIEHEKTGLLVGSREPEQLADAVVKMIESPERAKEMGRALHEKILHQFRLEDMTLSTLAEYKK